MIVIKVLMRWNEGADTGFDLPSYETDGAAGVDLRANFDFQHRNTGVTLDGGERVLIPTGVSLALPEGYEAQIRPRSGLALKHGITVLNSPGTIDSDYRGPIGIILFNSSRTAFHIDHGERIAQMVIAPVVHADFSLSTSLDETQRGQGGFGSTGVT